MLTCWSSHCSSGNTPHLKCRRKPWLQHDALNLYQHSLLSLYSVTIDRYKNETRKKCSHQYTMNWRSHHSVPDKHSSQWAGEKPGCSVMPYYGHLTSLDRWLTDIVNSTYSTSLDTPSRDYNNNHVTVVRSQSNVQGLHSCLCQIGTPAKFLQIRCNFNTGSLNHVKSSFIPQLTLVTLSLELGLTGAKSWRLTWSHNLGDSLDLTR